MRKEERENNEETVIKVENVSKSFKLPHERYDSVKSLFVNFYRQKHTYEVQHALKNVSFEIKRGEFFGIIGRNGSGKSTLLKILAGIYYPDQGEVKVRGKLVPFIELGVGFNPELTGRENVYLNGALLGFRRKEMRKMYDGIVEFAELDRFMDQKLKNYSSGMQVRLAFSIAIRAQGDILLLDEVLAVGDAAFQKKCLGYFDQLKKEKKTVVFVSHNMDQIARYCDRTLLIDDSRAQYVGKTNEAISRYMLTSTKSSKALKEDKEKQKVSDEFEFIKVDMNKKPEKYTNKDMVGFTIKYKLRTKIPYDIGVSIQKNGISLHERNTKDVELPASAGEYEIYWEASADTLLNGVHKVNIAAFTKPGFDLIAYVNEAASFFIESEAKAGGLINMKSSWRVES